jgi:uncharacterized protein YndB with AHSA1/START domain
MKILKYLGLLLIALIAVLLIGGMAISSKFSISRSVQIAAPPEKIFPLVSDPRAWAKWSVWNQRDPAMTITYSGPPSGTGAVWAWQSKSEGDGKMSFTAAEPPKRLAYDLFFPDFGTTSTGEFRFEPNGTTTTVTWVMNGDMGKNPIYHWFAKFSDKMIGPDFEAGLKALKTVAEAP